VWAAGFHIIYSTTNLLNGWASPLYVCMYIILLLPPTRLEDRQRLAIPSRRVILVCYLIAPLITFLLLLSLDTLLLDGSSSSPSLVVCINRVRRRRSSSYVITLIILMYDNVIMDQLLSSS
jgi:hypothetical protein